MATFAWPAIARQGSSTSEEQLLEAALARGREEGYSQGQQQALAEQAELKAALAQGLRDLAAKREALGEDYAAAITNLAFEVLGALLRVELVSNPKVVTALVGEALDVLDAKLDAVSVRVNPGDLEWLQRDAGVELVADDTVPEGGLAVSMPELCVEYDLLGRLRELSVEPAEDAQVDDADESPARDA